MKYKEIVAVTGLTGLYQLVTTKSDGAIVRNVADKSTKFISARQHNVTPLESIEVYTTGDNVRLHYVFGKMQEHEGATARPDSKSADNKAIKTYFKTIFPDFDEDRVYVSDMKKMLKWYELLKANDLLNFEEEDTEAAADGAAAEENEGDNESGENKAGETETAGEAFPEDKSNIADPGQDKLTEDPQATEKTQEAAVAKAEDAGEEKPKKTPKKKKAEGDEAAEGDEKAPKKTAKKKKTEEE